MIGHAGVIQKGTAMGLIFGLGAIVLGALFTLFLLVFYVFVIVDCAKHESSEGNTKVVWILVILFLAPPLGGIIYYLIRRPERISSFGQ